jgi:hypothetical protein
MQLRQPRDTSAHLAAALCCGGACLPDWTLGRHNYIYNHNRKRIGQLCGKARCSTSQIKLATLQLLTQGSLCACVHACMRACVRACVSYIIESN